LTWRWDQVAAPQQKRVVSFADSPIASNEQQPLTIAYLNAGRGHVAKGRLEFEARR